jgi:hypothetical protein
MDPDADPDPSISSVTFKMPTKKIVLKSFSVYYFLKVLLHHFSKVKSQKEVTKQ